MGGVDKLGAIKRLRVMNTGFISNALQEYDPGQVDNPQTRRAFTRLLELDFSNHQYRRVASLRFDGATLHFTDTSNADRVSTASSDTHTIWTRDGTEDSFVDPLLRYIPALLILRATEARAAAIWAGEECLSGSKVDLIDFSWNDKTRFRLSIGSDSRQVLRLQGVLPNPLVGDNIVSYEFIGNMIVGGISFPTHTVYSQHGVPFTDIATTRVEVNPIFAEGIFDRPRDYAEVPPASLAHAIGDGVYELSTGGGPDNYVHFFDLGDCVAVFDAPDSADAAHEVSVEVRRVLGDKPIRYVVISHFHDDHAAGVGYYVEIGARIVTTRDNAVVLTRYAHALSMLAGKPASTTKSPTFLFVDGDSLGIPGTDGKSITVYRFNNLPHVKSMLVAYYPSDKTIANSDLYGEFAPFDTNSLLFARWLRSSAAPKIDWIVGGHHRRISEASFQSHAATFKESAE